MTLDAVLSRKDDTLPEALDRSLALLRIPSISTDPAYRADCARAANWLADDLQSLGFKASSRATTAHPMVVGHAGAGARHLLSYGHYDVQPVDPLSLWARDPFDPAIEDTPIGQVTRAALSDEWDRAAAYVGEGGSIPIADYFKTYLGMDAMLVAISRENDNIHFPNEKYDLEGVHKGIRSWTRILARLM